MTAADSDFTLPKGIRGLKRREWDRLVELGFFDEERVELLYGAISRMSPQDIKHVRAVQRLRDLLYDALGKRALIFDQAPFAIDDNSEPEPDISIVDAPGDDHPSTAHLIVEVANTSLAQDRGLKARLYAAAKVPEYWVVNILAEVVEVYTEPKNGAYQKNAVFKPGEIISLLAFADMHIAVEKIFH